MTLFFFVFLRAAVGDLSGIGESRIMRVGDMRRRYEGGIT